MSSRVKYFVLAALFLVLSGFSQTQGCAEPSKELCETSYKTVEDQNACNTLCRTHSEFQSRSDLVSACEYGQLVFLTAKLDPDFALNMCDTASENATDEQKKACKFGVLSEAARNQVYDFAGERETGN